jgi:hypothetical protein
MSDLGSGIRDKGFIHAASIAALMAACLASAACEACPFQVIRLAGVQGTLEPGAFAVHDMAVPAEESLEIDLASSSPVDPARRVDVWVVRPDCEELFDAPYPGPGGVTPQAQCAVLIGPVPPNSVSARLKTSPGQYRIIVQAWATNTSPVVYSAQLGIWGQTCRTLPGGLNR